MNQQYLFNSIEILHPQHINLILLQIKLFFEAVSISGDKYASKVKDAIDGIKQVRTVYVYYNPEWVLTYTVAVRIYLTF